MHARSVELFHKAERVFSLLCYTELVMTPGVKSIKSDEPQVLGCCKLALAAGRQRERQGSGVERTVLPVKEE